MSTSPLWPGRPRAAPGALVVAATAGLVATVLTLPTGPVGPLRVVVVVLVLLQGAALLWASTVPVAVAGATLLVGAALEVLVPVIGPGLVPAAVFALAVLRPPRISLWGLAGAVAIAPLAFVGGSGQGALIAAVTGVATWSLGELVRSRRVRRAEAVAAVAEQERAALAREVHDIVGHSLATIIVQAGAADDVFDRQPDKARAAVRAIDASARAALGEVRRVIAGPADPHGLDDLSSLVAGLSGPGPAVELAVSGDVGAVPPAVAGSAYRIVQESLTNALRHADARRVEVRVACEGGEVRIAVDDDGRARPAGRPRAPGHGILGMRARAQLHGGTLDAAPRPGGGFGVAARLPLGTDR